MGTNPKEYYVKIPFPVTCCTGTGKKYGDEPVKEEGHSDCRSRGLSHHSKRTDAGGLDFRVRNGTG